VTSEDVSILLLTLRVAALATLLIVPLGVSAAYLMARRTGIGRTVAETLFTLPLVLPPTAVGFLLLQTLRESGPLGTLLRRAGVDVLFTWKAVVLATAVMSAPLLVRSALAAFEELDPRLLAMARSLGSGPAAVFRRVAVPLAWRGILSGTLLAFARALGEFGATILVAGSIPGRTRTLALAIFQRNQIGQDGAAMRLVIVVAVLSLGIVWASGRLAARRGRRLST
jgi:molybdate transport system permease protein